MANMLSARLARTVSLKTLANEVRKPSSETTSHRHMASGDSKVASFKVQDLKDFRNRVEKSKIPVIVDFGATWCNPCRKLTPLLESVIAEKKGKIALAKVDIDENTDLALNYDVASVPVLVAMKNGQVGERLIGLQDTDRLRQFVDKAVEEK